MIRSTSEKGEKNTNFPILSRILFIDLFLSSFKYIRIVFFFFSVFIQNRYWSSRASNGIYSNQRSDPRYSYRLQQYSTRSEAILFFQASFERKIIERESIIPLTDNNFSLKSLIFLTNISILGSNISSNHPLLFTRLFHLLAMIVSHPFFTGSTRRCCVKGKNVCVYIYKIAEEEGS